MQGLESRPALSAERSPRLRRLARRTGALRATALARAAMGVALATGGAAWAQDAEPNPYYIGLNQALTHNTNINNVSGGPGDTYSSTGLIGGVDQSIGRQHVAGSANVTLNRYRDFTQLNNTSYGLNAGWDWQTIYRLSGSLNTSISRSLASLQNNLLQVAPGNNTVRNESVGGRVAWGGNAALAVQGGYGFSKTSYSSPTLLAGDSHSSTADIGVYYQPGATLSLGTALRFTRSTVDRAYLLSDGSYLANETRGRNIDLSANWHPTVQSGLTARISYTKQTDSSGGPGFSGLTGSFGFSYMPTGKLSFSGQYTRDAGTNGSFYNTFNGTTSQTTVGLASNNSVSDSVSLGASYQATAKVAAVANVQYRRATQDGNANALTNSYRDTLTSVGLGVNWAIRRNWSAGCNASRVQRSFDGGVGNDYNGTVYACSTQVTLQ